MSHADAMVGAGGPAFNRNPYSRHQPTAEDKYRPSTRLPELSSLLNSAQNGPPPPGSSASGHPYSANSPLHSPTSAHHPRPPHHEGPPRHAPSTSAAPQHRPPHGYEGDGRGPPSSYEQHPYAARPPYGPSGPGPQAGPPPQHEHSPQRPGALPMHPHPHHEQERYSDYNYPGARTPPPPPVSAPPAYQYGPYSIPPHHMPPQQQPQQAPGPMPGHYPPQQPMPQATGQVQGQPPRQRTSIACRYCRKRKIRCSGYANSPGGRCMNCTRMNQECVFQPVSSTGTNAAFVHISALQGTVPVGTPVFGAYGQLVHQSPPQSNAQPEMAHPNPAGPPRYSPPSQYTMHRAAPPARGGSSSAGSLSPPRNKRSTSPNIPDGHERRMPPPPVDARGQGSARSGAPPRPGTENGIVNPAFYAPRGSPSMSSSASMSHHGSPSLGPPPQIPQAFAPPSSAAAPTYMAGSRSNSSSSPAPSPPPSVMKVSHLLDDNKSFDRGMLNRLGRGGLR